MSLQAERIVYISIRDRVKHVDPPKLRLLYRFRLFRNKITVLAY